MGFTLACVQQASTEQAKDICSNTGDGFKVLIFVLLDVFVSFLLF